MNAKSTYRPPYTITPEIPNRVAAISDAIRRLTVLTQTGTRPLVRLIKSITS